MTNWKVKRDRYQSIIHSLALNLLNTYQFSMPRKLCKYQIETENIVFLLLHMIDQSDDIRHP